MERTKHQACNTYSCITYEDLDAVEDLMSRAELLELKLKTSSIIGNMSDIKNCESRALMEKMFRMGYLAAHVDIN